ncbi:hypothetical protein QAD02_009484 [Eretmocerus hayati]|uniref:Uncharacterized protein n=1 Tax=Eretmocerus hayati TaxID=131215 RepID=A0ACC2N9S7_9HYME|nr:hypothetical protein QAD02_009484 [Eretmocerus hayati]
MECNEGELEDSALETGDDVESDNSINSEKLNHQQHEKHPDDFGLTEDVLYKSYELYCNQEEEPECSDATHQIKNLFSCELCGKRFKSKTYARKHIQFHSKDKPFSCDICGKAFKWSDSLLRHKVFHINKEAFSCGICNKPFKTKNAVKLHEPMHSTDLSFACSFCDKKFKTKPRLQNHLRTHTSKKVYLCPICGKDLYFESHLKAHYNTHIKARRYQCSLCQKYLSTKYTLAAHIQRHKRGKLYTCKKCNGKLDKRSYLHSHQCNNEMIFPSSDCHETFHSEHDLVQHYYSTRHGQNCHFSAETTPEQTEPLDLTCKKPTVEQIESNRIDQDVGEPENPMYAIRMVIYHPNIVQQDEDQRACYYQNIELDARGMPPCSSGTQNELSTVDFNPVARAAFGSRETSGCDMDIDVEYDSDYIEEE